MICNKDGVIYRAFRNKDEAILVLGTLKKDVRNSLQ